MTKYLDFDAAREDLTLKLMEYNVELMDDDIIAGGFIRDFLLGRPHGDLDLFSPVRDSRYQILHPDYLVRATINFYERTRANICTTDCSYEMPAIGDNKDPLKIDHKFFDEDDIRCISDVTKLFMCSICQFAYSHNEGFYISEACMRTLQTKVITFDLEIPNWNEADNDPRDIKHHYQKMVDKFPDYTIEELKIKKVKPKTYDRGADEVEHWWRDSGGGS